MKVADALLFYLVSVTTTVEAVKIERRVHVEHEVSRELRYKGKNGGKNGENDDDALFDQDCLAALKDTCRLPDCIPLDASSAPSVEGKSSKGKSGKGKNGDGKGKNGSKNGGKSGKGKSGNDRFSAKGKGKSSEAPVRCFFGSLFRFEALFLSLRLTLVV